MNTIERIRKEVERMKNIAKKDVLNNSGEMRVWNQGIVTAYNYVLSFLDTLQDNPVCYDLDVAARECCKQEINGKICYFPATEWYFKAGAKWQKERCKNGNQG